MKRRDIQELATREVKELRTMLKEKHEELFSSSIDHSMGKLKNTASLSNLKDDIARIKTMIKQKEAQNGKTA